MVTKQRQDLVSTIIADHDAVRAIFDELESGSGSPQHRRDLTDHVITELVRHSVAEEQFVYPAARKSLPGGNEIVDHDLQEHAEAEQVMKQLEDRDPTTPEFEELLEQLMSDIRHHLQDEESDLLPKLRQHCDRDELFELGEKFEQAKKVAPTRPHPSAPDQPPANLILDPGAGLIDRLRDRLSGRKQ